MLLEVNDDDYTTLTFSDRWKEPGLLLWRRDSNINYTYKFHINELRQNLTQK